jgi:hypothetical protein
MAFSVRSLEVRNTGSCGKPRSDRYSAPCERGPEEADVSRCPTNARIPRTIFGTFTIEATTDPALIPQEDAEGPAGARESPQRQDRKTPLSAGIPPIPAQPASAKRHAGDGGSYRTEKLPRRRNVLVPV